MAEIPTTEVDTNNPVVSYRAFTGLRNTVAPERLNESDLVTASNVDIDRDGTISRRGGYTRRLAVDAHSLWSDGALSYFVSGGSMYRFESDFTSTLLASGLSQGRTMRYVKPIDVVYHSNGVQTGAIQNGAVRSWGIRAPVSQPKAAQIGGLLPAGAYQFAVTFERNDGQESGTGLAGVIDLTADDSGIRFTSVPVSSDLTVQNVRLYLSPQNGDKLFLAAVVANGTTAFDYTDTVLRLGDPLRTQFMNKPLPMHELAVWNGRVYGFNSDRMIWTEVWGYELMRERNYMPLGGIGRVLAPVTDGVYVATDSATWFFKGSSPEDFRPIHLAGYGAVAGTLVYIEHDELGIVPMWESSQGKVVGTDSGQLKNVTRARYTYSSTQTGAALFRQTAGLNQYISVLQG